MPPAAAKPFIHTVVCPEYQMQFTAGIPHKCSLFIGVFSQDYVLQKFKTIQENFKISKTFSYISEWGQFWYR